MQLRATPFTCCVLPFIAICIAVTVTLLWPLENQHIVDAIKAGNIQLLDTHIAAELNRQRKHCLSLYAADNDDEPLTEADITELFNNQCDITVNNIDVGSGRNLLHAAVQNSQSPVIDHLIIHHSANINAVKPNDMRQPIHIAAAYTNITVVQQLHQYGADLSARALNHWSPLLYAVLMSHTDILQYLIDHGVSVNDRVEGGLNALQLAIIYSTEETADMLVRNHAYLNSNDKYFDDYQMVLRRVQRKTLTNKSTEDAESGTMQLDDELDDL